MGTNIDNFKLQNKDKLVIGSCIELEFILDDFSSVFNHLQIFLNNYKNLFNFDISNLSQHYQFIFNSISTDICNLSSLIDCEEKHCDFMLRYY